MPTIAIILFITLFLAIVILALLLRSAIQDIDLLLFKDDLHDAEIKLLEEQLEHILKNPK